MDQNHPPPEDKPKNPVPKGFKPFPKGTSGNPSERRRMDEFAKKYSNEAIEVLVAIMRDGKAKRRDRIQAAGMVLDKAWGKPAQAVQITGSAQNTLVQVLLPGTINDPDQWAERTRRIEEVRRQPLIEAAPAANGDDSQPH
jgi:hypothetical protein